MRSWSVTITHAEGKKWDAEGPGVRNWELLVAAHRLSVCKVYHTPRGYGKWGEAGLLKQSACLGLTMTLKLTLSCWPSLRYSRSGPTAGNAIGSSTIPYSKKIFSFYGAYLMHLYINVSPFRLSHAGLSKLFKSSLRRIVLYSLIALLGFLCLPYFEFIFLARERQNM